MNVENYRRFLEAVGHRVIASPSSYWYDVAPSFFKSILPFRPISPNRAEINTLFRQHCAIGLIYYAPQHHVGKHSWFYIRRGKDYDLGCLHPKMRNKVRQGLRNCTVRPITFEYLCHHGMPLNLDTLKRHGRDDPAFSQPSGWVRLCQAGQHIAGAGAWGAFVGDQLAAYMITFITNGYSNILYQMSRTDLLHSRANNALGFVATQEMLASPGIDSVSYGEESIRDLPGLDEYKIRLGYEKQPVRCLVILHPVIRAVLLNRVGDLVLGCLNRLFSGRDFFKRLIGTIDVAKRSAVTVTYTNPGAERLC